MFGVVSAGATSSVTIGTSTKAVTGHRVIASATSTWNTTGTFPTTKTGTIAYSGVSYCNSCHDLRDDNNLGRPAFPHGLSGVVNAAVGATGAWRPAVWLTAGAYAGAPRSAVGAYNDYTGSTVTTDAAGSSILDGTCLKCHRGDATTNGVGLSY
jgi:cytochrome c2